MPRLFALDKNFPQPIVGVLSDFQADAQLVPLDQIDSRMSTLDDWELLLALHPHTAPWDGLITTDSSMLAQGPPVSQAGWPLVITPGERGMLQFAWDAKAGELTDGDLLAEVFYSDLAGRQHQPTRLELTYVTNADRTHIVVDIRPGIDPDLEPLTTAE